MPEHRGNTYVIDHERLLVRSSWYTGTQLTNRLTTHVKSRLTAKTFMTGRRQNIELV